jgi:hypothetical protein
MQRLLIVISIVYSAFAYAQNTSSSVQFEFSTVPTSTYSYTFEITENGIMLTTYDKIPKKRKLRKNSPSIKKMITTTYFYNFSDQEKKEYDSLVTIFHLDSVELYLKRVTEMGKLWKVQIKRNSITYNIDLPNFYSPGLEALLKFVACIIPEDNKPHYGNIKCS